MDTSLEALYACRNHWQWIWITKTNNKLSYPPANDWPFGCACCLYAGAFIKYGPFQEYYGVDSFDRNCDICPLNNYAWNINDAVRCFCEASDYSLYNNWKTYYASEDAYKMVQACNRAIEDILCNS